VVLYLIIQRHNAFKKTVIAVHQFHHAIMSINQSIRSLQTTRSINNMITELTMKLAVEPSITPGNIQDLQLPVVYTSLLFYESMSMRGVFANDHRCELTSQTVYTRGNRCATIAASVAPVVHRLHRSKQLSPNAPQLPAAAA
jgi:hypothetical protein